LFSFLSCINDRNFHSDAARRGRVCVWIVMPDMAAMMLISMLTPRTIVSIGDGYCWDLWCLRVEQVNATPQGQNTIRPMFVSSATPIMSRLRGRNTSSRRSMNGANAFQCFRTGLLFR